MTGRGRLTALAVAAVLSGCATAAPSDETGAAGYLDTAEIAMLAAAVPVPAPSDSVAQSASDRYRTLEDTDRWFLATAHAELHAPEAAQHFDCALGTRLASNPSPSLTKIMDRLLHDIEGAASIAKARDFRPRPVGVDADRRSCQQASAAGRASAGYPSSSASAGAAYAELMAELAPDRAVEVRRIGREIGLSRLVCGMHYPDQFAAGFDLGMAVWQTARLEPAFARDLEAARADMMAARATGLSNPGCAAERLALATPLP